MARFVLVSNWMNLASLLYRLEESQLIGFMNYNGSKCWIKHLYSNEAISVHGQWLGNIYIQAMPVNKFRLRFHHAHAIIHFLDRDLCFQPHLVSIAGIVIVLLIATWHAIFSLSFLASCSGISSPWVNMTCHCRSTMQLWLVKKSVPSRHSCIKLSATSNGCWTQIFLICIETVTSPRRARFSPLAATTGCSGSLRLVKLEELLDFQALACRMVTANLVSTNIDQDGRIDTPVNWDSESVHDTIQSLINSPLPSSVFQLAF